MHNSASSNFVVVFILVTIHPAKTIFTEKSPTIVIKHIRKNETGKHQSSDTTKIKKDLSNDQIQKLNTGKY